MEMLFNLDYYFNNNTILYSFFDAKLKESHLLQKVALKKYGVSQSVYRSHKNKNYNFDDYFKILAQEFKITELNDEKKEYYEVLINKIIYRITKYNKLDIPELETSLLACIKENNCLKPIFELFYVLLEIFKADFNNQDLEIKDIILKLLPYTKNYFMQNVKYLYYSLFDFLTKSNKAYVFNSNKQFKHITILELLLKYKDNLYTSPEKALIYNQLFLKEVNNTNNFEYIRMANIDACYLLNVLKEEHISFDLSKKLIGSFINNSFYQTRIIENFLYSSFVLEKYNNILLIYLDNLMKREYYSDLSLLIIYLTLLYLKKYDNLNDVKGLIQNSKLIDILSNKPTSIDDFPILEYNIIKTYIKNNGFNK